MHIHLYAAAPNGQLLVSPVNGSISAAGLRVLAQPSKELRLRSDAILAPVTLDAVLRAKDNILYYREHSTSYVRARVSNWEHFLEAPGSEPPAWHKALLPKAGEFQPFYERVMSEQDLRVRDELIAMQNLPLDHAEVRSMGMIGADHFYAGLRKCTLQPGKTERESL